MKIFLISPVRNATDAVTEEVGRYVEQLEQQGHEVHWPIRDTEQMPEPKSMREWLICIRNALEIRNADEVHVWFDPNSKGSLFDLGVAWEAGKMIRLANPVEPTEGKSFSNLLIQWDINNTRTRQYNEPT